MGPGRPARGTLVSTVPTVAPGPVTGMPKPMDAGEASRGQRCLTGPRHVERCGCARGHDLLGFNGQPGGARHVRGNRSIKPGAQTAPVTSPITPPTSSSKHLLPKAHRSRGLRLQASMAPKRAAADPKGKATVQAGTSAAAARGAALVAALPLSRINAAALAKVRYLAKITRRILWALAGRPVVPWFPLCRQSRF